MSAGKSSGPDAADKNIQSVTFQTFCDPAAPCDAPDADIVVMSCDRYLDDHDDGLWSHLASHETQQAGMAHLGDQLYNDMVVARLLATREKLTVSQMTEAFRNAYREAWSHAAARAVMTRGAHWMIPDDHDVRATVAASTIGQPVRFASAHTHTHPLGAVQIINNLDAWMLAAHTNASTSEAWNAHVLRHLHTNFSAVGVNALPAVVAAGHAAYFEYQAQLQRDLVPSRTWRLAVPNELAVAARDSASPDKALGQQVAPLVPLEPPSTGRRPDAPPPCCAALSDAQGRSLRRSGEWPWAAVLRHPLRAIFDRGFAARQTRRVSWAAVITTVH